MADRYDYDRGHEPGRERSRAYGDDYPRERSRGREDERSRNRPGDDRGFMDRASDEVRSWFGDDEAGRRRQRDEIRDERDDWRRGRPDEYDRTRGYGGEYGRERGYAVGEDFGRSSGASRAGSGYSGSEWSPRYSRGRSDWERNQERSSGRGREDWSSDREDWTSKQGERFAPIAYSYSIFAWSEPGPFTGRGPRGYQRSDDRIREDICDRLTRHGRLDATDISITVRGGEVTLEGTVDNREAKRMAEDAAESVDGVREVNNNLKTYRGRPEDVSSRITGSTSASNVSGTTNIPSGGGEKNR